jgi:hypothetical protein
MDVIFDTANNQRLAIQFGQDAADVPVQFGA